MLTATAIVVLHVIVWDCSSGTVLVEFAREMPEHATAIESCQRTGVERALRLTKEWKAKGHPNVSTNVDCHWERGASSEPA
jgi:hypothetical protein